MRSFNDVFQEWDKAHPYPKDGNAEAVKARHDSMVEASAKWIKDWPNETNAWAWRLTAVAASEASSKAEIEKAGEDVLASNKKTFYAWTVAPYPRWVAQEWIDHDIRLRDCLGLLQQARAELDGKAPFHDDRTPTTAPPVSAQNVALTRADIWRLESQVHRKLGEYDQSRTVLAEMKAWIDAHPGEGIWPLKTLHEEAATLAEAEGHKPDAIANYQQGYQTRATKERAKTLWTEMGGTPEGFELWWKHPDHPPIQHAVVSPMPWVSKNQPLAALNAHDLTGKAWTIADLKGKTTLINVWATWCEPCRRELPAVQKLYDQVKDRKDIQVISIDTDEDPGLLDSFLKNEHYTFPIVLAKALVDDIAGDMGIPRNWIVDATGSLRQESMGHYETEWPGKILAKLAEVH